MDGHIFLSYAAEDREIAQQLARHLELRGCSVWWDRKIPAGRPYDEVIEEALKTARCALVLWTRSAVVSRFVRAEASDAAQRDILVPVLLEEVAIPLEFRLIQAIDLRKWDRSPDATDLDALGEAIARISGQPLATAAASESDSHIPHVAKRRPKLLYPAIVVSVCALAAGLGWYWDAFYREQLEYYATVRTRWGFPEGVGHLTAGEVARRNVTIALVRNGRRHTAHEIRLVNAAGNTPPEGSYSLEASIAGLNPLQSAGTTGPLSSELAQVTRVTFAREEQGRILEQVGFNRGGRRLYTIHFAEPDIGEYKRQGFGAPVRESGISYLRFSRHANGPHAGLEEKVLYLDDSQRPQADEWGNYGYRLVRDDAGLVTEAINLGPEDSDRANSYGVLKEIFSHNQMGNIVEATTVDDHGALALSRLGSAVVRLQYDEVGNVTRASFLDTKRQPVSLQSLGAAGFGAAYDRRGNRTSMIFFGPDQRLVAGGPLSVAKIIMEWQSATRSVMRFEGTDGRPIPALAGAFEALQTWDPRGYVVEVTYRDEKGDVTRVEDGCAGRRMHYDDLGNLAEYACLNERGAETITTAGYALVRSTYDVSGNELTTSLFTAPGMPGVVGDTYESIRRAYSLFGKVEKETYLDAKGVQVNVRQGFAAVTHEYDSRGNEVTTRYWDTHGDVAPGVNGCAAIRRAFDGRGLEIENACLDANDKPVRSADEFAIQRLDYDPRGYIERIRLFGENGRPSRGLEGYSSARIKRNAAGQRLEMTFFDETGAPLIATRIGTAKRRWTYDAAGRVVERSDYDTNGKPLQNAYGYASVRYSYDEYGRERGRELLDIRGQTLQFNVSVDRITPGSVAVDASLRVGDVILSYDGEAVSTSHQFTNILERLKGDRARELGIRRGEQTLSVDLPPGRLSGLELAERVIGTK